MVHEIDELKRITAQPELTKSDVAFLMSQVRNVLESRNLKSKYSVLNLYCNWCFHTKIERSDVAGPPFHAETASRSSASRMPR